MVDDAGLSAVWGSGLHAMREILFGTSIALAMALSTVIAAAWPSPGQPVAALFAQSASRDAISAVAQAEGRVLDIIGQSRWIISVGDDRSYVASLYRLGAWLVIDARMAALCFGSEAKTDA
jgi:hypothetical protein